MPFATTWKSQAIPMASHQANYMTMSPRDDGTKQVFVPDFFGNYTIQSIKANDGICQSSVLNSIKNRLCRTAEDRVVLPPASSLVAMKFEEVPLPTNLPSQNRQHALMIGKTTQPDDKIVPLPFVESLMQILSRESKRIISWNDPGTCFQIHDKKRLEAHILPKYFQHGKYYSFTRQLNYHGFKVVAQSGSNSNAAVYSHEHFTRDNPLLNLIKRKSNKKRGRGIEENLSSNHKGPKQQRSKSVLELHDLGDTNKHFSEPLTKRLKNTPSELPSRLGRALSWSSTDTLPEDTPLSMIVASCVKQESMTLPPLQHPLFNSKLSKDHGIVGASKLILCSKTEEIPSASALVFDALRAARAKSGQDPAPTDRLESLHIVLRVLEFCSV